MSILDAILNASEKDLADLDDKIADHTKQLEAMRSARKVIAERLGVEAPKKVAVKRITKISRLENEIYVLLEKQGAMSIANIASRIKKHPSSIVLSVAAAVRIGLFTRSPDGDISIAKGP